MKVDRRDFILAAAALSAASASGLSLAADAKAAIELPKLPWEPNALEPVISSRTVGVHYGKHHKGYLDNLNKLLAGNPLEGRSLEEVVRETAGKADKDIRETLDKRYANYLDRVRQLNSEDVFQTFMNAYASSIEPHTNYLGPRASENFDIAMKLSLEGIGALVCGANKPGFHLQGVNWPRGNPALRAKWHKIPGSVYSKAP